MILYRCEDADDYGNSSHYHRIIEDDRREDAENRKSLWHYTNLDVLFKILANRTIRFSRIDCVNDILEKEPLEGKISNNNGRISEWFILLYRTYFAKKVKKYVPTTINDL